MKSTKYQLDTSSKKWKCPFCNQKTWVRYTHTSSPNDYLEEKYGRCDREVKCGIHTKPGGINFEKNWSLHNHIEQPPVFTPIPKDVYTSYREADHSKNMFLNNLKNNNQSSIPSELIDEVSQLYRIGTITSTYFHGAVCFPYIDHNDVINAVQVMLYDRLNKRKKQNFLHSIIESEYRQRNQLLSKWIGKYKENESKVNCFYGAHLLKQFPNNPVALVESAKTAVIATLYFGLPKNVQDIIWLGTYSSKAIGLSKIKPLKNRTVLLIPDLSKDDKLSEAWVTTFKSHQKYVKGLNFKLVNYLDQIATNEEKDQGLDLADYLIRQDWKQFRVQIGKA